MARGQPRAIPQWNTIMKWHSMDKIAETKIKRKFAWTPTKLNDGSTIWFEHYYEKSVFVTLPMDFSHWDVVSRTTDHPERPDTGSKQR